MTTPIQPLAEQPAPPRFAIVGGGISGLTAAYEAVQRGEKNIDIYESSARLGGKIVSGQLNGSVVNRGAEFIDSDNTQLVRLCNALNVPLVENKGMELEFFQRANGSLMDAGTFYKAYEPYAQRVMRDRAEMETNPNGPRAQHVRSLSLDSYINELRQNAKPAERSWLQSVKEFFTDSKNESADALFAATNVYSAEAGQPAANVSAAQFIAETSPDTKTLLTSDCKLRVEGGTEQLVVKLREHLAAKGVRFHTNKSLTSISKLGDGSMLNFADGTQVAASKTMLALPTYNLAQVQGLESLGMDANLLAQVHATQYTNSVKCTVALKDGALAPDAAIYGKGFQAWSAERGQITFLINADQLGVTQTPKQLLSGVMHSYAQSLGTSADKLFDVSKLVFSNPGKSACYASPRADQLATLDAFKAQLPALAKNGVGIAGTYLPHQGGYGFMECGLVSAQQSVDMLLSQEKAVSLQPQKLWAPSIEAQRAAANDNPFLQTANVR